jgi:hypothetical protein
MPQNWAAKLGVLYQPRAFLRLPAEKHWQFFSVDLQIVLCICPKQSAMQLKIDCR